LEYRHHDAAKAEEDAQKLAARLSTASHSHSTMIGPVPCFFAKVGGYYRWQIVLRGSDPKESLRDMNMKLDGWRVEVDPVSLL
jgi:primosomal protein N'